MPEDNAKSIQHRDENTKKVKNERKKIKQQPQNNNGSLWQHLVDVFNFHVIFPSLSKFDKAKLLMIIKLSKHYIK